jgi:hypothetical protein
MKLIPSNHAASYGQTRTTASSLADALPVQVMEAPGVPARQNNARQGVQLRPFFGHGRSDGRDAP